MTNIQYTAAHAVSVDDEYSDCTTRFEIIRAVRGEIFDRNGEKLVGNRYIYDIELDSQTLPTDISARNDAITAALDTVIESGNAGGAYTSLCPLEGIYPDMTFRAEATDSDSRIYAKYQAFLEKYKDKYKPENADDAKAFADFIAVQHKLITIDKKGNITRNYSDNRTTNLIRIYYDMEAYDFGYLNNFVLASDVGIKGATAAAEAQVEGLTFSVHTVREYLYPGYASHILGRTGKILAENWDSYKKQGYDMNAIVGISGCELAFEDYLRGQDGLLAIVEDADGNIVEKYEKKAPIAGNDIYLTIDINIQIAAEDGLADNAAWIRKSGYSKSCDSGALVAQNPDTGEILALASYPSYDLSTFGAEYNALVADARIPLLNRALDGLYAPGSTFKIGMAVAGLTDATVLDDGTTFNSSTKLYCGGTYTYYDGYQPDCWIYNSTTSTVHQHGYLNVSDALRVSCNCFFYDLGRMMGIEKMNKYCTIYGLGQATGIELNESHGILAGPAYREENGLRDWNYADTIAAAIGQSDNIFTPMQISVYLSTILSGGTRYRAGILREVRTADGAMTVYSSQPTVVGSFELSDSTLSVITSAMRDMVTSNSTVSYFMSSVPVSVGGKSGTAQTGKATDNALFVSAAPYDDPEIVVCGVLENGAGGSYVSMSCARVLKAYFDAKAADSADTQG